MTDDRPQGSPDKRLERTTDELEHRIEQLGDHLEDTRQDWERKRADPSVPGAVPDRSGQRDTPPAGAPTGGAGERAAED